ncbi:MAG: peptide ABC transporter substrate-binding protein [Dehalococcoidia bacterium]
MSSDWTVQELVDDYQAGRLPRRRFINKLLGAGIGISTISMILAACGGDSDEPSSTARDATPGAGVATSAPQAAGDTFTPTKRGGGGQVRVLWWQAPSTLNPHLSSGTKDIDGSSIFYERLAYFDNDANLVPRLAAEAPSQDAGTLAPDLSWAVWKLKQGVQWHDGTPFTAEDVVFTFEYATDPDTAALSIGGYKNVQNVEKVDDHTVRVTLKEPSIDWAAPFYGSQALIIPKHIFGEYKGSSARNSPNNLKPVGTGPFKLVEFRPDDLVLAEINENYHIENRPYFDRLEMKGGGDAVSAARAVLQTGEFDFAWNLQVDGIQLASMEKGGQGVVNVVQGGSVEHVQLNYTDPNTEVDGERSSLKAPHPFFTDLKVRQAFALAMDRQTVVDQLYGKTGEVALFFVNNPKRYVPDATWSQDLAKANQLLDEAGWKKGGDGVRTKDGTRMKVLYQTSVNKLRQDTQAVVKQNLEALGVAVELKAVIADVFFAADPENPDNFPHFYSDMQMYTTGPSGPDNMLVFLQNFLGTEVAQKANNWSKPNRMRYVSPEFDALFEAAGKETDAVRFAEAVKKMQQKLLDDVAMVPLVARGGVSATKNNLKGVQLSGWASNLWALPFWHRPE